VTIRHYELQHCASFYHAGLYRADRCRSTAPFVSKPEPAAFSNPWIAGGYVVGFQGRGCCGVCCKCGPPSWPLRCGRCRSHKHGLFDSNIAGTNLWATAFPRRRVLSSGHKWRRQRILVAAPAKIAGTDFAFYVVDATRLKFVGTSFPSAFVGDCRPQQNIAFNDASLSGSFAFLNCRLDFDRVNSHCRALHRRRRRQNHKRRRRRKQQRQHNPIAYGTVTAPTPWMPIIRGGSLTWTDTKSGDLLVHLLSDFADASCLSGNRFQYVSDGTFSHKPPLNFRAR